MESWGFSSAGRAPALQAGGQRFDPVNLHQMNGRRKALDNRALGIERRHLTNCRWQFVTAVAFQQKSDPVNLHHSNVTKSKPSEAGLILRGETAEWMRPVARGRTKDMKLISTRANSSAG